MPHPDVETHYAFGGIAGLVLLMQWSVGYRHIRRWLPLVLAGLVVYRKSTVQHGQQNMLVLFAQEMTEYSLLGDVFGLFLVYSVASQCHHILEALGRIESPQHLCKSLGEFMYGHVKGWSFVKTIIGAEVAKLEASLETELKVKARALGTPNSTLPEHGLSDEDILLLMDEATKNEDPVWKGGLVSGAVYHAQEKHIALLNRAFSYYSMSNALFPGVWPSLMKFEAEIIAMTAALVCGGDDGVVGCTTSGGSESVIMSIKAHRDYFCARHGISRPELICAVSAHAAVDKACDMLGIRLLKVALDPVTLRMDIAAVEASITANTVMLYASAPSYPHGSIDDVPSLGQLAQRFDIGLHVDCCLGGFILPFARQANISLPFEFDFSVPGVTGMSLDAHKYGCSLKGSSVVLYRHKELRHAQYFCYADWTGGLFTTPTLAGSRSGGLIAQAWASMMSLGQEQYRAHSVALFTAARRIAEGVRGIEGLRILGLTDSMIVCFASNDPDVNVYSVGDQMQARGWSLNALQGPACVHLCLTLTHLGREERFLQDLRAAAATVKASPRPRAGNAAIYGLAAALPPGPVSALLKAYNDVVLKL